MKTVYTSAFKAQVVLELLKEEKTLTQLAADYHLRDVTPAAPNHVWGTDITFIRLRNSWMYLVAVLDWYSRYIVSWAFDDTLEIGFVLDAAREAPRCDLPLPFPGFLAPAVWRKLAPALR